ncbi:MAG: rhomboid family intramembrane serine protease [Pseudomonadota bacterium]
MQDPDAAPFNPLPPAVIALAVVIGGIEAMFQLATAGMLGGQGGIGWRVGAFQDYAVFNEVWDWMVATGNWPGEHLLRFVAYPFLHQGAVHAIMVVVFVLALGKLVAEQFSAAAFLAIFAVSSLAGAFGFLLFTNSPAPLVGGYPGAFGLIGAFTFILWVRLTASNAPPARAFTLIGFLAAVQLLFGILSGDFGGFAAEVTGFAAGFFASFVLSPGGWHRVIARLRQR